MRPYDTFILWTIAFVLIIGGMIAASSVILRKVPSLKKIIDALKPYSTAIGIALIILGGVAGWFAFDLDGGRPVGANIVSILLGIIMSRPLLKYFKMEDKTRSKIYNWLNGLQATFGIIGIVMGIIRIIANLNNFWIIIA